MAVREMVGKAARQLDRLMQKPYYDIPGTDDPDGVLAYCDGEIERARRRDQSWHGLWYLLTANFVGRQWAFWNSREGELVDPGPLKKREITLTFNRILPKALKEASALTLRNPNFAFVPSSLDERALSVARMDGKLMRHHWAAHNLEAWENQANLSRVLMGMVWYEVDFDHTAGALRGVSSGKNGMHEFAGSPVVRTRLPFDVLHDADASDIEGVRWIAVREMVDCGWLRLAYIDGKKVNPEKPDPKEYLRLRLQSLSSHNYVNIVRTDDTDRFTHHAAYTKFWRMPDDEWPEGREVHFAGRVVLYDGKWRHPYLLKGPKRLPPLIPDYYIKVPGRMKGMGLVENLLEPQWEYNKLRSQAVRIRAQCANPKWVTSRGHQMEDAPDDLPNELVEYTVDPMAPNSPPRPETMQIPVGVFQEHGAATIEDFNEISSQHEVSSGQAPTGVTAGVAIEKLQLADERAKGHPHVNHVTALRDVAASLLGCYREYGDESIVIAIAGTNYEHEFAEWRREESKGAFRVEILNGSGLPQTRSEKAAVIQALATMGFWEMEPLIQNKILRYLEYGQLEEVFKETQIDDQTARRENDIMLATATLIQPDPMDNHDIHIQCHSEPIKSRREIPPEARARLMAHITGHLFHKSQMQKQIAELAVDANVGLDQVADRVGDEVDREDPEGAEPGGGKMQPTSGKPQPGGGKPPQGKGPATARAKSGAR